MPADLLKVLFEAIRRNFTLDEDAEVTIEANPDDVTSDWLKGLEGTPVNRISMGAQSFSNKLLELLGRRHDAQQTVNAVQLCKEAGLVLTGIVVSVSVSAFSLALIQRIYGTYGTVDMRELLEAMKKRGE